MDAAVVLVPSRIEYGLGLAPTVYAVPDGMLYAAKTGGTVPLSRYTN
jgi:hypothetical protein